MSRRPASATAEPTSERFNPHVEKLTEQQLRDAVANYYGTKTVLFDKALAEKVLDLNTGNRRVNKRKVERLAEQMRDGSFENTGEPIIISAEGVLNDGQHRLLALVESDVVLDMDVRFGIPRRTFTKTDTGSSRTGGDVLVIRGVAGGAAVAPALRLLVLFRRGLPDAIRDFVSNAEIDQAYEKWKSIETIGKQIAGYKFPKGVRSTPLLATAFMASRSPAKEKLPAWLETLATGLTSSRTDPGYFLRERLMHGIDAPVGTREGLLERFALMIMSWNAFAAGEGVNTREFRWNATGKSSKPFPKVEGARL